MFEMRDSMNGLIRGKVWYEDKKCMIKKDRFNYAIANKNFNAKTEEPYITFIHNPKYLFWELCDERKFFKRDSRQVIVIQKLLDAEK